MPYRRVSELPAEQVRQYGTKQRRAFMHAFNSAIYDQGVSEERAFKIAHTAAKQAGGASKKVRARRKG